MISDARGRVNTGVRAQRPCMTPARGCDSVRQRAGCGPRTAAIGPFGGRSPVDDE
jgi:hypothetical protein